MQHIKYLIEQGQLVEALDLMIQNAKPGQKNEFLLQKSRLAAIEQQKNTGQLSYAEFDTIRNNIAFSLLQQADTFESADIVQRSQTIGAGLGNSKGMMLLIGIVILILVIYLLTKPSQNIGIQGNNNSGNDVKIETK